MHKLGSGQGDLQQPVRYPNFWSVEPTTGPDRLVIAPAGDQVDVMRALCEEWPGDYFLLHSGRLTIPAGRHFCLYALQAVLPFLAAKQRSLCHGDWLKDADRFICPDPAGNVIMRVERVS